MRTKYRPPEGILAASFKGVVQIINKKDGTHIARAWQPKEGPPKTAINKLNTSTFSTVVKMIKNSVDLDVIGANDLVVGTSLLPRDVLMMAATGTIFQFRFPDGYYLQGGPQLSQSIQSLLDSISNAPGTILGRTAAGWQALVPAQSGWVLTSSGENNAPVYSPAVQPPSSGAQQIVQKATFGETNNLTITGFVPGFKYSISLSNINFSNTPQVVVGFMAANGIDRASGLLNYNSVSNSEGNVKNNTATGIYVPWDPGSGIPGMNIEIKMYQDCGDTTSHILEVLHSYNNERCQGGQLNEQAIGGIWIEAVSGTFSGKYTVYGTAT